MKGKMTLEYGAIEAKTKGFWIVDDWGVKLAFLPKPKDRSWSEFESQCMVIVGYIRDGRNALFGLRTGLLTPTN